MNSCNKFIGVTTFLCSLKMKKLTNPWENNFVILQTLTKLFSQGFINLLIFNEQRNVVNSINLIQLFIVYLLVYKSMIKIVKQFRLSKFDFVYMNLNKVHRCKKVY